MDSLEEAEFDPQTLKIKRLEKKLSRAHDLAAALFNSDDEDIRTQILGDLCQALGVFDCRADACNHGLIESKRPTEIITPQ